MLAYSVTGNKTMALGSGMNLYDGTGEAQYGRNHRREHEHNPKDASICDACNMLCLIGWMRCLQTEHIAASKEAKLMQNTAFDVT